MKGARLTMRSKEITNKVFTKVLKAASVDAEGKAIPAEVTQLGFLEHLSEDIRQLMAHYTKVSLDKWNVKAKEFSKVMAFIDNVNGAAWDVDSVNGTKLDRYNVLTAWESLFVSPRDVRFTDNRLSCPNLVAADEEEIDSSLTRATFNAYIDDINGILKSANGTVALNADVNVGDINVLKDRPLMYLDDKNNLHIYCRCDASEMKAPVVVDPDVALALYDADKWDTSLEEFEELFLEALRLKLKG
jgi:hypothetical protein